MLAWISRLILTTMSRRQPALLTSPALPIHTITRPRQLPHAQVFPVELLGGAASIRDQNHPSEVRHRAEDLVDALHHPDAETLRAVLRQDVHVGQVIDGDEVGDEAREAD